MVVQFHSFSSSTLGGNEWLTLRTDRFVHGQEPLAQIEVKAERDVSDNRNLWLVTEIGSLIVNPITSIKQFSGGIFKLMSNINDYPI